MTGTVFAALALAALSSGAAIEVVAGGGAGGSGKTAKEFQFIEPFGVTFDRSGNTYVVELKGNRLIRIDRRGRTSLVAGDGTAGFSGDSGMATQARLNEPHGIVAGPDGQLYIADTHNNRVRRIDLKTGVITTVAGTGEAGFSGDGGPAREAAFNGIYAIDLTPKGDRLYLADLGNRRVRMVDLAKGEVRTVAGNGDKGEPRDGASAADSPLIDPRAVAADGRGNVYILERNGNALRVVDWKGRIRTLIRPGSASPDLKGPKHLCIDRNNDVIIADAENHMIRKFEIKTGQLTTIAGTGEPGDAVVATDPAQSQLNRPHGVAVDRTGALYIADSYNHRILRVTGYTTGPETAPAVK